MSADHRFKKGNKYGFKPGQSGNPDGKPKIIIEVARAAREHTTQAIETLVKAMGTERAPWAARVNAACAILDRGWGRAPQTIEIHRRTDPKSLTDEHLAAIAASGIDAPTSSDDAAAPAVDPSKLN
jgi:hypothetical protein